MNTEKNLRNLVFRIASAAVIAAILFLCPIPAFGQAVPNGSQSAAQSEADMLFKLLRFQSYVQGNLNNLDLDVSNASQNLSATGLEETSAHEVLSKLLGTNSNLVETSIFGKDERIITAEGKEARVPKDRYK